MHGASLAHIPTSLEGNRCRQSVPWINLEINRRRDKKETSTRIGEGNGGRGRVWSPGTLAVGVRVTLAFGVRVTLAFDTRDGSVSEREP
jgi:hypothetical protein